MAVKTDSPQIIALRQTVEKRFGHPIEGRSDFSLLAMEIERITHEHIAENTLRRLWGKISSYDTVFTRTLDVLCRYVGCEHWNAFCVSLHKQSSRESDIISDGTSIKVEDLTPRRPYPHRLAPGPHLHHRICRRTDVQGCRHKELHSSGRRHLRVQRHAQELPSFCR